LTGAALCAALAFWSKQTFVVLLVAVPLLAWILTDGRRALLTGALGLAIAAAVGCALPAVVDMRAMLFNAVEIPARHPYAMKADLPTVLAATLDDFSQFAVWPTLAALFLVVWTLRAAPATGWRERLRAEPGMVVLLTAAALLPTSFVGRMKLGGANVSFAPTLTLLALAVGLLTLSNTAREGAFSVAIRPVLAAGLALVTILHAAFPVNLATRIEELSTAPQQEAYEFAKSHPGQAYFPWFPLPTILAEKKLYHSTYAIFDREIAGYRPSFEHVRSVFPDTLRYIAYKDIYVNILQSYFPEFTKVITVDGLPGWNVYSR
jgi:hypothetical protein